MSLITIKIGNEDMSRLVCTSLHESIKDLGSMYDYENYPEDVESDLAALNRVYQYYCGREIEL